MALHPEVPPGRIRVPCVNPLVLIADESRLGRSVPESREALLEFPWDAARERAVLERFGGAGLPGV